jgi:hypothetical protein
VPPPEPTRPGAVKGGPPGRPAGTAAKRRPFTAPVTAVPTMVIAPTARVGAWKTTTTPRSGAHLRLSETARTRPCRHAALRW